MDLFIYIYIFNLIVKCDKINKMLYLWNSLQEIHWHKEIQPDGILVVRLLLHVQGKCIVKTLENSTVLFINQ